MKIYHLKTCDTCRAAISALRKGGFEPELHDVRADGLTRDIVETLEAALSYTRLVNKRSTTWRGLDEAEKSGLVRETAIPLLVEHPTLMKRPVIEHEGAYTVGWSEDVRKTYLA